MKKIICMLMAFAMMLSASAFAEDGHTYSPESEAYAGIWYVDDYILEIEHSYDDYNLYDCTVTRYLDDYSAVRWSYGACAYDDVGKTLNSLETGVRSNIAFDEDYEVISNETVYEDGAASFAISEDGTLTWTDLKETSEENGMVFQNVSSDYIPNPLESYLGTWVSGRAMLTIEDLDDVVSCTILWGSSASEVVEWVYDNCTYDEASERLTTPESGVKTILVYGEDGEVASTEQVFDDGAASFALNNDDTLTWTDFKQTPGENELVFERLIPKYGEIIPTDELVEHYLLPVAGIESQTAGASLKLATTADEVWRFISGYDLSDDADGSLELDVLVAMDSLDEEKATAFAENFESVAGLLDACFEDFEANRGLLEDAGVAESLETICTDAVARQSWEKLRDGTRSAFEFLSEN